MPGKFQWKKFSEVDLSDSFFDTLKEDYPEFVEWFEPMSLTLDRTGEKR